MENETMLYKNNQPRGETLVLTLLESYKNFEYILFGYFDVNGYLATSQLKSEVMANYKDLILGGIVESTNAAHQTTAAINIIADDEIQQRCQKNSYTKISFIMGINRIN